MLRTNKRRPFLVAAFFFACVASAAHAQQGGAEAPVAGQEGDVVADSVTAHLDAAVVGVGGLVAVEPDCVLEEALDLTMQVRPVLLDGEQVVGPAPEDRLGDPGLAAVIPR